MPRISGIHACSSTLQTRSITSPTLDHTYRRQLVPDRCLTRTHPKSHTPILRNTDTLYSSFFPWSLFDDRPWTTGMAGSVGMAEWVCPARAKRRRGWSGTRRALQVVWWVFGLSSQSQALDYVVCERSD